MIQMQKKCILQLFAQVLKSIEIMKIRQRFRVL